MRGRKVLLLIIFFFLASFNWYSYAMTLKELKFLIFLWSCLIAYTVVLTSLIPHFSISLLGSHVPLQLCSKSVIIPYHKFWG